MGFLSHVGQAVTSSTPGLFFDLGSTTTRVILGTRLVYCEPSCVAVHKDSGAVLALGRKAYGMMGKTAPSVAIIFPISHGNWVSQDYAIAYLESLIKYLHIPNSLKRYIFGLHGAVATPTQMSVVQHSVYRDVLQKVGLRGVTLRPRPEAIFISAKKTTAENEVLATIDCGGQLTEVSVLVGGTIVSSSVLPWGGVALTEKVQQVVRERYACALGWQTAEEVKRQLLRVYDGVTKSQVEKWKALKLALRGKDIINQTAKTVVVSSEDFSAIAADASSELLEFLHDFFAEVPTELGTSIFDQGMVLSGGGSQLKGLKELLVKQFACEVRTATRPELLAVEGLSEQTR